MAQGGTKQSPQSDRKPKLDAQDSLMETIDELARLADSLVDGLSGETPPPVEPVKPQGSSPPGAEDELRFDDLVDATDTPSASPAPEIDELTLRARDAADSGRSASMQQALDELDELLALPPPKARAMKIEVAGDQGEDIDAHLTSLLGRTAPPDPPPQPKPAKPAKLAKPAKPTKPAVVARPPEPPPPPPQAAPALDAPPSTVAVAVAVTAPPKLVEGTPPTAPVVTPPVVPPVAAAPVAPPAAPVVPPRAAAAPAKPPAARPVAAKPAPAPKAAPPAPDPLAEVRELLERKPVEVKLSLTESRVERRDLTWVWVMILLTVAGGVAAAWWFLGRPPAADAASVPVPNRPVVFSKDVPPDLLGSKTLANDLPQLEPVADDPATSPSAASIVDAPVQEALEPPPVAPVPKPKRKPATEPAVAPRARVNVDPPVLDHRVEPRLAAGSLAAGDSTEYDLRVLVDETGRVARVVVEGDPTGSEAQAAVVTAVLGWRYTPARREGAPVREWVREHVTLEPARP